MSFVIGLVIGLALGAAIVYFLNSKKTASQSAALQDLQRQLALAESEHERRLREATDQLRRDYAAQASATSPPATSSVSTPAPTGVPPAASPTVASAETAFAGPPPTAVTPTEPLPTPPPHSPRPEVSAPPATATAPAPIPQATQSPAVPAENRSTQNNRALEASARITDPNALLAASYAPQAATRREVADAIAKLLPQSGASAQARWFPILSRLARDADPTVRLTAVQALRYVPSSKRSPLLRRALKDADPAVVATANTIINQSKGRPKSSQKSKKRRLPKNR